LRPRSWYDPFTDFTPVSQLVTFDFGIAIGPAVPSGFAAD